MHKLVIRNRHNHDAYWDGVTWQPFEMARIYEVPANEDSGLVLPKGGEEISLQAAQRREEQA